MSGLRLIWGSLFSHDEKPVSEAPVAEMAPEDRDVIVSFAKGAAELRPKAVAIHRKYLSTIGPRGNDLQRFMAEVDNGVPDYVLRDQFRQDVLERYAA